MAQCGDIALTKSEWTVKATDPDGKDLEELYMDNEELYMDNRICMVFDDEPEPH
jgi:hypothetical protein